MYFYSFIHVLLLFIFLPFFDAMNLRNWSLWFWKNSCLFFVGKMHQMVHKRFAYVQSVAEINVAISMHEEMCQNRTWNICRDVPQTGYEIQLIGCYTADDTTDESLSTV